MSDFDKRLADIFVETYMCAVEKQLKFLSQSALDELRHNAAESMAVMTSVAEAKQLFADEIIGKDWKQDVSVAKGAVVFCRTCQVILDSSNNCYCEVYNVYAATQRNKLGVTK